MGRGFIAVLVSAHFVLAACAATTGDRLVQNSPPQQADEPVHEPLIDRYQPIDFAAVESDDSTAKVIPGGDVAGAYSIGNKRFVVERQSASTLALWRHDEGVLTELGPGRTVQVGSLGRLIERRPLTGGLELYDIDGDSALRLVFATRRAAVVAGEFGGQPLLWQRDGQTERVTARVLTGVRESSQFRLLVPGDLAPPGSDSVRGSEVLLAGFEVVPADATTETFEIHTVDLLTGERESYGEAFGRDELPGGAEGPLSPLQWSDDARPTKMNGERTCAHVLHSERRRVVHLCTAIIIVAP